MILGENYFKFIRLLNVFTFLRIKVILLEQFKNKKKLFLQNFGLNDFYQLLVKLIFLCLNFSSQIICRAIIALQWEV